MKKIHLLLSVCMLLLAACTKDIDIKVPQDDEKLVVEAYVNNLYPNLNYVIISKTINYFKPDFRLDGNGNASVFISEGKVNTPGDTAWHKYTLSSIGGSFNGLYTSDSLKGKSGYVYKLEITVNGEYYYGYTTIPDVVPLDSITQEIKFKDPQTPRAFMTVHFNEPATLGQNYRPMFRYSGSPAFFAWGDIADSNQTFFNDDNANGVYRHFTYPRTFKIGDTLQYYLANMDRNTYNFWQSYESARQNGGPFATPVQLRSNVFGKNVAGSFSGFAVDHMQVIFKK